MVKSTCLFLLNRLGFMIFHDDYGKDAYGADVRRYAPRGDDRNARLRDDDCGGRIRYQRYSVVPP